MPNLTNFTKHSCSNATAGLNRVWYVKVSAVKFAWRWINKVHKVGLVHPRKFHSFPVPKVKLARYTSTPQYASSENGLFHSRSNSSLPSMAYFFSARSCCILLCIFGSCVSAKVSKQNLKDLFLLNQTSATDSFHLYFPPPLLRFSYLLWWLSRPWNLLQKEAQHGPLLIISLQFESAGEGGG